MNNLQNRIKSDAFFHALPENFNCAQAILKGFQNEFGITTEEIEEYRAWGGGRAEGGVCGALFAAERLLRSIGKESVVHEFNLRSGGTLCSSIKEKRFTCTQYVRIADELVEKYL